MAIVIAKVIVVVIAIVIVIVETTMTVGWSVCVSVCWPVGSSLPQCAGGLATGSRCLFWWHCLGQPPSTLHVASCKLHLALLLVVPPFDHCHVELASCLFACLRVVFVFVLCYVLFLLQRYIKKHFNKLCALLRCMLYNSCTCFFHMSI